MSRNNLLSEQLKREFSLFLVKTTSQYARFKKKIRWFTPIGNVDNLLRDLKAEKLNESKYYRKYYSAFRKYSYFNRIYMSLRVLLYAGIITSVGVAIGLPEFEILLNIASYIGFTVIAILYLIMGFLTLRAREEYYLRRELLISDIEK